MIVYVESNFALELALLRSEHQACMAILESAERHKFRLALPAFCIGETYEAWIRRSKQRRELYHKLRTELGELARSQPYETTLTEFEEITSLLTRSNDEEKQRLDAALERILNIAEVIPIRLGTLRTAIGYQQSDTLQPQDSIVFASVLQHLNESSGEPACFVTKNTRDFDDPDIGNELRSYNCRLIMRFSDALGYIHSRLPDNT